MHAIVITGPDAVEWRELPVPEPGPGQALIRSGACGICATDLHLIARGRLLHDPAIPGHEWSGTVAAVGPGADPALVERRVIGNNHLPGGGEVGFQHPGGYAEYFLTDAAMLYTLPDHLPMAEAALIEPLAVCLHGLVRLGPDPAGPTLIIGDGPIGLLMLLVVRRLPGDIAAAPVTLVGGRAARLDLARELGATAVVDYHAVTGDFGEALMAAGGPFPTIIEASGAAQAVHASLHAVVRGGRILLLGDYGPERSDLRWVDLLRKEMSLIGSGGGGPETAAALRLAASGDLPLGRIVTHLVPAADFRRGLALASSHDGGASRVVLTWGD